MKRVFSLLVLIVSAATVYAQTLDEAIKNAANEMSGALQGGSTIAVVSFESDSPRLTDHVIGELNERVVAIGNLKAVERRRINDIRGEIDFNLSGVVSDESAQKAGKLLGAQSLVMGSIELIGDNYRLRFQAISTQTGTIQYSFSENIKNDRVLETLLAGTNALVDFTPTQRWTASALNLAFGAGSFFIEGDKFGGGVTAALEGVGTVLFIYALAQFNTQHSAGTYGEEYDSIEKSYEAYPFFIGIGSYIGGVIFGAIRAQIFHKPGSQIAQTPFDGLNIDLVSAGNNNPGLQVSYTWRY